MLSLWNPATHQSKETSAAARFADRAYDIGFGFDLILSEHLRFATVYHSNSDNWIEISVPDNVFDNIRGAYSTSSVTIVKDCPYWTFCSYTEDKHMAATAVKFDAGLNEFKLLPEFVCEHRVRGSKFVDMNDCLTSVVYEYDNYPFSKRMLNIFSLDGDEGCCVWSKMYTIGPFNRWFGVVQGFSGGEIVFDDRVQPELWRSSLPLAQLKHQLEFPGIYAGNAEMLFSAQFSVIELSEGLITFTRIFSPEAACEVIEAEMHSHVFYEAEPDIWMVLIVEKSKEAEAIWRIDALRGILKEVRSLFMMLHGSTRALLDKQPSGGLVRKHLYSFIMDYLDDFLIGKNNPVTQLP
ncbi:hypothetical protein ACET3Z_024608 [Daucus carota]